MRSLLFRTPGFVGVALAVMISAAGTAAPAPELSGVDFFEHQIRPILVEHCYQCHSKESEKIKGGLLLDTRDGLLKGGDTGPGIVPGDPEKSLLIKAVRYEDENLQMPPKGKKLAPEQIAALETWVKMGAPDPRTSNAVASVQIVNREKTRQHWAYRPIASPPTPSVKNQRWVQTPVDAFVLHKLEAKSLTPSPRADRRTLIRRATYDLIGLPPTLAEVDAFLADRSPDAFAKVVDRLLTSPQYGERWARYWLDVARYADTKGYVFEEERRYAYAYTYRDYVIRAFNEDLPFDQFIIQQIAADLLPLGDDKRPLAALGYLTLGRRFLNNQPDIIDDRIDVVTRGMMGLTVTCARCHDHKYDPIPTKDYYSIYGVFASCNEPNDKPLLGATDLPQKYPEYLAEREKRETELKKFREDKEAEARAKLRSQVGDYLLVVHDSAKQSNDGSRTENLVRERKLSPVAAGRWRQKLEDWRKENHPIFAPWFALEALDTNEFAAKAKDLLARFSSSSEGTNTVNPLVARALADPPASLKEVAQRYSKLFADVDKQWKDSVAAGASTNRTASATNAVPPAALPDADREALRQVLYAEDSPVNLRGDELTRLFDTPAQQKARALRRKVDELDATHPGAPPRAMVLQDNATPTQPHVFVRGNPGNQGPEVLRQFLEILSGEKRQPFQKGSGRLELAQAIASKNNPLTARVLVNRVWLQHFGTGLVRTPSDFGVRSDPPTHPQLLDYLAARFMDEGWSIKKLHRAIMLSSVYQQSSEDNERNARIDPANQLLWKMNRRRLDFEAMRDTLLMAAGRLDPRPGGASVDLTTEPFAMRRTVYGFIERQNLPGLFRTFDFASPDTTSPQRFSTTVPQQALFLLNSPFVVQQAQHLVERPELKKLSAEDRRVERLYQIAFERAPSREELKLAEDFLHHQVASAPPPPPAWQYGVGEFDDVSKGVKSFQPLPYFNNYSWQGGTNLPDPNIGWVLLNADGGHPGNDQQHAAIRRWTAPRDGTIRITGELAHNSDKGDGVRGRIVSSSAGELGQWVAQNQKAATKLENLKVMKGDAIDFVTDCRESVEFDSFTWAPVIKFVGETHKRQDGEVAEWNAKTDFSGPPKENPKSLSAWEKYAQVLLLSNELVFVD